jgi:hypothetical protein
VRPRLPASMKASRISSLRKVISSSMCVTMAPSAGRIAPSRCAPAA